MVTMKTAARLREMAAQSLAIADFLYENGGDWRDAHEAVSGAAALLAAASRQIETRAESYRRVVSKP